jgi:hypothetical protein
MVAGVPERSAADCGQIIIFSRVNVQIRPRPYVPPPPPSLPDIRIDQRADVDIGGRPGNRPRPSDQPRDQPRDEPRDDGGVAAYPPPEDWRDEVEIRGRSFREPNQYAVIAWNGREEILWLSTAQRSTLPGDGAALSVLPLPGRPISVTKGDKELFRNAKASYYDKADIAKQTPLIEATIGAHNIFVLEGTTPRDLIEQVQGYIRNKFGEDALPLFPSPTNQVLEHYTSEGFRYFAFDLIKSTGDAEVKVPIQYRFESDYAYYPLYVSRMGGTGETEVEAMVFTPGGLTQSKAGSLPFSEFQSSRSVPFTTGELRRLDDAIGDLFGGAPNAQGRLWQIRGTLDGFQGDIMAR